MAVTTYDVEKNEGRGRIWLVPSDGGEARPLTAPELSSSSPAFSPDGRQLAFTRKGEKGKPQLHVMPLDGGEARAVTSLPLGVFDPMWLPNGSGIVFGAMVIKGHATPEATAAEIERRDRTRSRRMSPRTVSIASGTRVTGEAPHYSSTSSPPEWCATRPRPRPASTGWTRAATTTFRRISRSWSGIWFDAALTDRVLDRHRR